MSAFPIALEGTRVTAVVVGGGSVGTRKAAALVAAGARVRVIALRVTDELESLAAHSDRLTILPERYVADMLGDERLVIAATNSAELNAEIAADARARGKLVNRADAPDDSDFHTMAIHRAGEVVVGVVTGGVPAAATHIRDSIAARLDSRYAGAIEALRDARSKSLTSDSGDWPALQRALLGPDFCDAVESGRFAGKMAEWR